MRPSPKPAVCHPEKAAKSATDPRCGACYRRDLRAKQRHVPSTLEALAAARLRAEAVEQRAKSLQELISEAERELQEAIPEAARAYRTAIKVASDKGDHRPAESLLTQFSLTEDAKRKRMLEPVVKQPAHEGSSGPRILIGVRIDSNGQIVQPTIATSAALPVGDDSKA